ncbi:MAG TPA: hypothetical protein VET27_09270 [Mycobacterium sp.]|nr:hypothetical protein [Mycobacterium sp.]
MSTRVELTGNVDMLGNSDFQTSTGLDGNPWKWEGPQCFCFTVSGSSRVETVLEGAPSTRDAVGVNLDPSHWAWVPIPYSAALFPLTDSVADGIAKLVAAIGNTPVEPPRTSRRSR